MKRRIVNLKGLTALSLVLGLGLFSAGCSSARNTFRGETFYRPPLTPFNLYRVTMTGIHKRSDGNYARARGLGGGMNPGGQAGQENQAGGINTLAMRAGTTRQEQTALNFLPQAPPDIQPAFPNQNEIRLTDMAAIVDAPQRMALVGRLADLTALPVQRVISERAFWVGETPGDRMLAVLDPAFVAGSQDGRVVVRTGNLLSLGGQIESLPSTTQLQRQWGLTPEEAQTLQGQEVYLHIDRIRFLGEGASPTGGPVLVSMRQGQ